MAAATPKAKAKASEKKPLERIEHEGLLDVRGLTTHFKLGVGDVKAVQDVSFVLKPGESLGLAGESGCGKTTAALSLLKLLPENGRIVSGDVLFDGRNLAKRTEYGMSRIRWKEISIIFQGAMNALNPVKETGKQIAEPIQLHEGLSEKQAMVRVRELFDLVGINPKRVMDFPHQLSGGMRQRAMIAMALACNPKLVIGDEPTTALDVMVQAQILELIGRLRKELDLSFILISHDLSVMAETCDKGVVMYAGEVVESGTTADIFNNATHPYTRQLIKAFPNIHEKREMVSSIKGDPPNLINPPAGCAFEPRCDVKIRDLPDGAPGPQRDRAGPLRPLRPREEPPRRRSRAGRRSDTGHEGGVTMATEQSERPDLKLAPETGDVLFDIKDLEVYFPIHAGFFKSMVATEKKFVKAVDHISFQIKKGEILALVGESGCGKTTTGRALLRLEDATGGEIIYKGKPVQKFSGKELRDYRKKAQIIFQDPYNSINPKQTIFDIVAEPLEVNNITSSEREKEDRVITAISEAGLRPATEYLYRYPHELSGGQRQRVCIAGATVLAPDVIVADEPVASLDVSIRNDILKLMVEEKEKLGVTYVFITHDLSLAWVISDRIAVMYLGRIVEIGETEEVVANPQHPYTKALISVIPVPDPLARREHVILKGETPNPVDIPSGCRFHPRCPEAIDACKEIDPQGRPHPRRPLRRLHQDQVA